MNIEEDKYYRTRDGRKVGPMKSYTDSIYPWCVWSDGVNTYKHNGKFGGGSNAVHCKDIVSIWDDVEMSPVREIKVLSPGFYDHIGVWDSAIDKHVRIEIIMTDFDAKGLRDAARTFIKLAEFLEEIY